MNRVLASTNKRRSVKQKKNAVVTPSQIDRWCAGGEIRTVEYTQADNIDSEDIVAMANGGGGVFLLGVEQRTAKGLQKGEVVGVRGSFDTIRGKVMNSCKNCMPSIQPRIQKVRHPKGVVVAVFIDKPHTVTSTSAGTYTIRLDGGRQPLNPERLKHIFIEQEAEAFLVRFRAVSAEILDKLVELGTEVAENISSLHEAVEPLEEKISSLHEAVEPLEEKISSLREAVEPLEGQISSLHESVEPIQQAAEELNRNLLFDFKHGAEFTPIPPVRDIVKRFSSGAPPNGLRAAPALPKLPDISPLLQHLSFPSPL
jgi:chaperonin cofactor prefoldin